MSMLDVDAVAEFNLHLGRQSSLMEQLVNLQRQASVIPQPFWARPARDAIAPANGILVLEFRPPPVGEFHYIRNLVVGGIDPTIASPGIADVFVCGSSLSGGGTPQLQDWRDRADPLPNVAYYGEGEMVTRNSEMLQIRLSGCTPGQSYAAAASIQVFREGMRTQVFTG